MASDLAKSKVRVKATEQPMMLLGANSAPFPEVKRMNHITITLHTIIVGGGIQIQYARVVEKRHHDTIGRSVMLYRLTSIQLREARIAERANQ